MPCTLGPDIPLDWQRAFQRCAKTALRTYDQDEQLQDPH